MPVVSVQAKSYTSVIILCTIMLTYMAENHDRDPLPLCHLDQQSITIRGTCKVMIDEVTKTVGVALKACEKGS